jgi:SAM-dependent methyltransferase
LKYAKKIKSKKNPLKFLLNSFYTYYPVVSYLTDKQNLDILEIGCGCGYLIYSLNNLGHRAIGIDISEIAIKFAIENFGPNYFKANIDEFIKINKKKFDLIIAIETIEHLPDPLDFIKKCFILLKKDGRLILTTPNKDYYRKDDIWRTNPPPVHLFWLSSKSFQKIALDNNLEVQFVNFSDYFSIDGVPNKLVHYLSVRFRKEIIAPPVFLSSGEPIPQSNSIMKKFLKNFMNIKPIKFLCNLFFNLFFRDLNHNLTLGVILWKKT